MKKGFTCSAFDLLHAGHISMLKEAKTQCDYLICGLQNNPSVDRDTKNKPIQSLIERQIQLSAVKYVDEIIVYNTEAELEEILKVHDINIRILGDEYKDTDFTGNNICKKRGIEIYFNSRPHDYSSTELRNRIANKKEDENAK